MLVDEVVCQYVLHVACIEESVGDAVDFRVYLSIFDGLGHILDTDHFLCLSRNEVSDSAGTGIEVIHQWGLALSLQSERRTECKFACHRVEVVGLLGIRLVETLRANLELQVFHRLVDMVFSLEHQNVLIANGVVAFLVVKVE